MKSFRFELVYQSKRSRARVGKIHTPHGVIDTPNFVGVGTNGTMKAVDSVTVDALNLQLMFCNTYHLMLQPGADIIKKAGGIHTFINRSLPIITDSGGFQVFSLAYGGVAHEIKSKGTKKRSSSVVKIDENGVTFRSYRDGTKVVLTPEASILAQKKIGADIMISFDELPPYHISKAKLYDSFQRTHRWEKRSLNTHHSNTSNQALYGVIHGGVDLELRKKSCEILTQLPFEGFSIGGSVGKDRDEMIQVLKAVMPLLPTERPNHLLGIGDPKSIKAAIPLGIDTFDSAHPTKTARHGLLFTSQGRLRILASAHQDAFEPPDSECSCFTCKNYTRAYLFHLMKAHEPVVMTLATIHNINYMVRLMSEYRKKILNGDL